MKQVMAMGSRCLYTIEVLQTSTRTWALFGCAHNMYRTKSDHDCVRNLRARTRISGFQYSSIRGLNPINFR